jgi:alpha-glucosidase (family GH31 glycosyl hydrolase)
MKTILILSAIFLVFLMATCADTQHALNFAPMEKMPLFVKEGSFIVCGPVLQYTTEKPADPITIYVFSGRNTTFALHEDEGATYNYEKGEYSTIPTTYEEATRKIIIGKREGRYAEMSKKIRLNLFGLEIIREGWAVRLNLTGWSTITETNFA